MHGLVTPLDDFRSRNKFILLAQRFRRPLAVLTIFLAVLGMVENMLGVDALFRPNPGATTHFATGLFTLCLAAGLAHYRPQRRTPMWRYAMSGSILCVLNGVLGLRLASHYALPLGVFAWPLPYFAGMGSDTALVLAFFFASVITRRHFGRTGLFLVMAGISILMCGFLALSFGNDLFEGQMAVSTMLALFPAALAVLTLYAHRPFARVLLLSGPVGYRTRMTLFVGFIVPWMGGVILHRFVGVPERASPVEALVIGVIILSMCAVALFSGYGHEKADRERRVLGEELRRLATMDALTGVLSRNGIRIDLLRRWDTFQLTGTPTYVLLFDLDHFKQVNDTFGHDIGDKVLTAVGQVSRSVMRVGDAIGRWGGEEFLVVANAKSPEQMAKLAERLRTEIAEKVADIASGAVQVPQVTVSIGVAAFDPGDASINAVIKRADLALYAAKGKGRDQVIVDPVAVPEAA